MPSTASFWTIINNVYDSSSAALRMNLSYDHTHSSGSGSGGQLDWDVIWSDAVHSHGTDTEGGQLDWDVVWMDAVHTHGTNTEGGQLDWDIVWADAVHTHGTDTEGGTLDAATAVPNAVTKNTLTTLGDIPYATGSATWARLAIGSANAALQVNTVGTGYSWVASMAHITSGSYTGDGASNRAIAHSLGLTPKVVFIDETSQVFTHRNYGSAVWGMSVSGGTYLPVTASDGTNFYVGNAGNLDLTANGSGRSHYWVALG